MKNAKSLSCVIVSLTSLILGCGGGFNSPESKAPVDNITYIHQLKDLGDEHFKNREYEEALEYYNSGSKDLNSLIVFEEKALKKDEVLIQKYRNLSVFLDARITITETIIEGLELQNPEDRLSQETDSIKFPPRLLENRNKN